MNAVNMRFFAWRSAAVWLAGAALLASVPGAQAATHQSAWAFPGSSGRVLAQPDALGNRILDYSGVGYRNGTTPIPDVPVKITLSPIAGDDGATIQSAINALKGLPLDTNGFRGAILLTAGEYQIAGSIIMDGSGIVLRGAGDGTNGTVLRATGTGQRTLIRVTGSGSPSTVANTTRNITNNYVPVGARSFDVNSTSGLAVGDRVMVRRIATDEWIQDLGMDLLGPGSGGADDVVPWTASGYHLDFDRIITRIEGNRITVDAPITCAIEARYAGGTIRKFTWAGRINNVGIEDIRGVSDFDPSVTSSSPSPTYFSDENHAWSFISFNSVENAWVRRVTSQHFGYACVALNSGSRCVTVQDSRSLDPVSIITGSRRYAFVMNGSQLCLVQNSYTHKDRHQFVTQARTMGPNVFVDGLSDICYSDTGPHHRWGTGAIWDNVTVNGNNLNVQNRGNSGTGHGWAGANEVVWNCNATGGFIVQNPPGARNWLIGSIGTIRTGTMWVGPHDPGTYDAHGTNVFPNSLYYAQLQDRLAAPGLQTREYWVGNIDQFVTSSPTGEVVTVDAVWRTAMQAEASGVPLHGFDLVTSPQFVPFTFNFSLAGNERIVGASLALAMRAHGASTNRALYLEGTANPATFDQLGWNPVGTGTNTTVRVLDLGGHLSLLADGKLNVALRDDVGVDWALLELQVAPIQTVYTNLLTPVADATVRGGVNAGVNFGSAPTLDLKADSQPDNRRQSYLRWNLTGYSGQVLHARLRLAPVSVGTNGIEHGVTLANTSAWDESTLTWSNQPGGGQRFATWIPAANGTVECVVTPQVQAALAGDRQLALQLFSLKNVGAPGLVSYASSEHADPALRPQLLLVVSNPVPDISVIKDRSIPVDGSTGPVPFTIGDPVHASDFLTLGAVSSNPGLLPASGLVLGGSLSDRTLTATPVSGQTGSALVTVTVTNPLGQTAASQFTLFVTNNAATNVPASGNWIVNASGTWADPANWSGGMVATGADMTATFAVDVTATRFINNDFPRTLGSLVFSDSNPGTPGGWVITNSPITLQVSNGVPVLGVSDLVATIQSPLAGTQGFNKQGTGTLELSVSNSYSGVTTINGGALRVTADAALGSPADGTTIQNPETARLEVAGDVVLAEPLTLACKQSALGHPPAVVNVSGTNTLAGQITLTTGGSFWTFEAAGGKLLVTGATTNSTTTNVRTIWLRGGAVGEWSSAIGNSAAGLATAIRKDDTGVWNLTGNNSSSGTVTVSNGTLNVLGTVRGTVNVFGGTFGGTGLVTAPVNIAAGAALAPGPTDGGMGTLTMNGQLTLGAGSTTWMELNALNLACDRVVGLSHLVYGGTLVLSNVAGTLLAGQSFQLFQATNTSGSFASLSPASPGPGLAWSFHPATGTLSVLSVPPPQITEFGFGPGNLFSLSGTGPAGEPYRILTSTNLTLPLEAWMPLSTGDFFGGVFSFTDPHSSNSPLRFYRVASP